MILVTGGTGLVGIHLLMELCQSSNSEIVAIYRTEESLLHASEVFLEDMEEYQWKNIKWLKADVLDIPSLEKIFDLNKISEVYHCAGYVTFQTLAFEKLKKVNIEGTANLVNLSIDNNIRKFCYVSSIATLNLNPGQNVIDEESKWNSEQENSGYAISKFGGEMEVWRGSEEGLSVIIVHPGVIIGKGFTTGSSDLFNKVNKGLPFYTSGGSGYISALDVARSIVRLMKSEIKNDNFVLVAENLAHKKVISIIAKGLNKKLPKVKISKGLVSIIVFFESIMETFLERKPMISKDMVDSLYSKTTYSSNKFKKIFEINFESMEEVILRISKRFVGR